jgi:hypothetical protein
MRMEAWVALPRTRRWSTHVSRNRGRDLSRPKPRAVRHRMPASGAQDLGAEVPAIAYNRTRFKEGCYQASGDELCYRYRQQRERRGQDSCHRQ